MLLFTWDRQRAVFCCFILKPRPCESLPAFQFPNVGFSPSVFPPPLTHLTCSQFPRQRPSVYSPGSPSCVCQFVPWCFPPLGRPVLRFPRCRPAFCFSVSSRLALVCFWLVLFSLNLCFVFVALCLAFWTVFLFSVLVSLVVLLVFCSPISCLPHESAFVSSSSFSL